MPCMPRPKSRATKIANALLGTKSARPNKFTKKLRDIEKQLMSQASTLGH